VRGGVRVRVCVRTFQFSARFFHFFPEFSTCDGVATELSPVEFARHAMTQVEMIFLEENRTPCFGRDLVARGGSSPFAAARPEIATLLITLVLNTTQFASLTVRAFSRFFPRCKSFSTISQYASGEASVCSLCPRISLKLACWVGVAESLT